MRRVRPPRCVVVSVAVIAILVCCLRGIAASLEPNEVVRLGAFDRIFLPMDPLSAERSMAEMLQKNLLDLYGVDLAIISEPPEENQHAIILGRRAAIAAGTIGEAELEAVKYDGYVIKASADRISLAGYAPQGTIYAAHALLRRLGLKTYPWRNFGAVEIRQPLEGGEFAAFTVSSKPFFSRRDLLGYLDQGRWGASLLEYGLGEFRFVQDHEYFRGKGWLGGDHTAPYLVPMAKYYDDHPEYYAMIGGERIPKDTQNARVALCLSNPDVHRIAADRAIEWMGIQHQRRFFHITDGDTMPCECPQCLAEDPLPGCCTDRYLKWVNSVARAARQEYPDNVMLALAYSGSTQPPVKVRPESNVVVMYCPWYWTSRTTSAAGWANPLNITAMKEYMAWTMMFPDQMGLYDYPGSWVYGQADRLKFLAKNDARIFYSCGGNGDMFQWVNANLLWDPLLNTEDLVSEFVRAYYGPAAEPMRSYQQLRREAMARNLKHSRWPFRDAQFLREARALGDQASALSDTADKQTQARILSGARDIIRLGLDNSHPEKAGPNLRATAASYIQELEDYIRLSRRLHQLYGALDNRYAARVHNEGFLQTIASLGIALQTDEEASGESVYDRAVASLDDLRDRLNESDEVDSPATARQEDAANTPGIDRNRVTVTFDAADETDSWLSDGTQAALIRPAGRKAVDSPCGETQTGIAIHAPLAQLPVIPHHNIKVRAGRFYAERVFDPPLDAAGCCYLDFHVFASCDVPITVYINQVHSDIDLHAGEQIVRVDMRNFDREGRFTYEDWDKRVERIGLDIWPQDNYYPYPQARDTEIVFLGMTASDGEPTPQSLPHQGQAIWLSQFRPNIGRGVAVPRELYDQYMQRQHYRHVGIDYGSRWISEGFRTFTEHRGVSPLFAIMTGPHASDRVQDAAITLQSRLEEMFGVRLPINPDGLEITEDTGNVFLLGPEVCQAAGRVQAKELQHVGPEGFVINAHQGCVAIAGPEDDGVIDGVIRYLEDLGMSFRAPQRICSPDLSQSWLHELYLLDRPYFHRRPIRLDWQWEGPDEPAGNAGRASQAAASELAGKIKEFARSDRRELPPSLVAEANRSALSRYIAAKLLWDPFADATQLIRDFQPAAD